MKNRGFTLIELLVVMSIIAILVGIIHPTLSVSIARSRRILCQSNLHQIGTSASMYMEDYDTYPKSLQALNRQIIRDESVIQCAESDKPYYFNPRLAKASPDSVLAACAEPGKKGHFPHDGGDTNVAVRLNGKVMVLRR